MIVDCFDRIDQGLKFSNGRHGSDTDEYAHLTISLPIYASHGAL